MTNITDGLGPRARRNMEVIDTKHLQLEGGARTQWWMRPHTQLGGKTPLQMLSEQPAHVAKAAAHSRKQREGRA